MKKNKSNRKKLTIERSTVRNLDAGQLGGLAGGLITATDCTTDKPSIPCSWDNC